MRLERSPAALVLEGVAATTIRLARSRCSTGFAGRYVALNPDPLLRMQEMTSDPTETAFIRGIDGEERIEDL